MIPRIAKRVLIGALCLATAWFALRAEAVGEEVGGLITGNFNNALYLGSLVLLVAAVLTGLGSGKAWQVTLLGCVLVTPMQTWRLAPGLWCFRGMCSVSHPTFLWDTLALVTLGSGALTLIVVKWMPIR